MGKIELFLGPMFSGKTTALINRYNELEKELKKINVYKPAIDKRYGETVICSHDKISITAYNIKNIEDINTNDTDVIIVDEFFFFKDNLIDHSKKWKKEGKHVIIAGLDMDYMGEPMKFSNSEKTSEDLIKIADEVHYLKANCAVCGKDASMTDRTIESEDIHVVGGTEAYRPVCKEHHPKWKK